MGIWFFVNMEVCAQTKIEFIGNIENKMYGRKEFEKDDGVYQR